MFRVMKKGVREGARLSAQTAGFIEPEHIASVFPASGSGALKGSEICMTNGLVFADARDVEKLNRDLQDYRAQRDD